VNLHPYIVHFAVALLLASVALFIVATLGRRKPWSATLLAAARWNLWLGAPFALASIATGFFDYIAAQCDADTIAATIIHRRSGAVTWWSALVAAVAAYRTRHRAPGPWLLAWLLVVGLAATTATVLGTRLTYGQGLGVDRAWPADAGRCFATERAAVP